MDKNKLIKTVSGVVVGVGIGHFAFKSKSPLFLISIGIVGGLLANALIKTSSEKKSDEAEKYLKDMQQDIEKSIVIPNASDEEQSNYYGTNREMQFDKSIGYHTPTGTLSATEPKDFMDIDFK